jgi:uncharacterized protein YggE
MKHPLARFVAVLCLVLAFLAAVETVKAFKEYRYIGYDATANNTVVVHGEGEVFAPADIATFSFGVVTDGVTVAEAQSKETTQMKSVVAALMAEGIADADIKTENYSVYPKYASDDSNSSAIVCTTAGYCPPQTRSQKIVGYEVSQSVSVKVRQSDKAGDVVSKVGSMGVTNISGIDFTIDDQTKLQEEARQKAIADAKQKAAQLASDLGVSLGSIVGYSENQSPIYFKAMDASVASGAAVAPAPATLPQGQNKVTSDVDITYKIR